MSKELERMLSELAPKQAAFLRGLMEGKGQTDAYQAAYGGERASCESGASRLLRNDKFRAVHEQAIAEAFGGLIDGLKELSPVILRRIRGILHESDNEAVVVRLIDSVLDRIGVVRGQRHELTGRAGGPMEHGYSEPARKILDQIRKDIEEEEEGVTSGTVTKRG